MWAYYFLIHQAICGLILFLQTAHFRSFFPNRLSEYETVFAITVHKAQGSEFGKVLLLLPDGASPVVTRELIYTALTRAKRSVEIWGNEDAFLESISRRIERRSGLIDSLR